MRVADCDLTVSELRFQYNLEAQMKELHEIRQTVLLSSVAGSMEVHTHSDRQGNHA